MSFHMSCNGSFSRPGGDVQGLRGIVPEVAVASDDIRMTQLLHDLHETAKLGTLEVWGLGRKLEELYDIIWFFHGNGGDEWMESDESIHDF